MKRSSFLRRLKKNRKGFSLVELIVATLILAIISASLSSIMGTTYAMYNNAEMKSLLYNVSQKLHIAIDNELMASQELTLYEATQTPRTLIKSDYQYCLQLKNGFIMRFDKANNTNGTHILLSERSYRDAKVTEFTIQYDSVMDRKDFSDTSQSECWRILYIKTTITKNGVSYSHTSAVRLYNMAVFGTEIKIKTTTSSSVLNATTGNKSKKFVFVEYKATQFFEIS